MAEPYTIADIMAEIRRSGQPVPWGDRSVVLRSREDEHEWLATQGINSYDSGQMLEPIYPEGAYENLSPMARPELTATSGPPAATIQRNQRAQPEPSLFGIDLPGRTVSELSDITAGSVEQRAADIGHTIGAPVVEAAGAAGRKFLGAMEAQRPELERAEQLSKLRRAPNPAAARRPMYRGMPVAQPQPEPDPRLREEELKLTERFLEREPPGPARKMAMQEFEELRPGIISRVDRYGNQIVRNTVDELSRTAGDMAMEGFGVRPPEGVRRMSSAARAGIGEGMVDAASGVVDVGVGTAALGAGAAYGAFSPIFDFPHVQDTTYGGIRRAFKEMEEEHEKRLDRDTIDNIRTDISDLMSVIPSLATMVFDMPESSVGQEYPERLLSIVKDKFKTGETVGHSMVSGLAFIVANPIESLHTMPITTLLTLADIGVALKRVPNLSPKVSAAIEKVQAHAASVQSKLDDWSAYEPGTEGGRSLSGDIRRGGAAVQRFLGDPTANVDPVAHLLGDELTRGARQEGAASRAMFESMARELTEDPDSGFVPSGTSFKIKFEEFDKTLTPDGKIAQPTATSRNMVEEVGGPRSGSVRKGERYIGEKGGARVRKRKVERVSLEGMVRKVRDELVNFYQPHGGGRSAFKAKDIDRAISEAVSFEIPNQVMMSKSARTKALEDFKAWVTNPKKADGMPKREGSYIPASDTKSLDRALKNAKKEIDAMAARAVPDDIVGSSEVYNLRLKMGDEVFSVLDDSIFGLRGASPELQKAVRSEAITALANRAAETAEQVRRQNVVVTALDDFAPDYISEPRRIREGDTIESIARSNSVTEARIRKALPEVDWDNLAPYKGRVIDGVPVRYKSIKSGGQTRFISNATPVAEFQRLTRSLEETGSIPPVLRIDPADIDLRNRIREAGDTLGGVPTSKVFRDLDQYKAIRKGAADGILQELGVIDALGEGSVRRVAKRPVAMPGDSIWVNSGTRNTLKWWAKDRAARSSSDWWARSMRWVKSNMTARNPTTHINNIVANATIQGIRRGEPLSMAEVLKVGKEYRDYVKGRLKDPKKREMYRAIERTGGLKTDMVVSELEAMAAGQRVSRTGLSPHKALERVYAWEDNVFKLEETARNYKYMEKLLDDLKVGDWLDLELTKGKQGRLIRGPKGWRVQTYGRKGKPSKSTGIRQSQVRDLIAQASMKPALDLFFDYKDVSQLASIIRGQAGGAASALGAPFYTWFSKAMTVPFVQKGVIGSMLSGRPPVNSNSAAVIGKQLTDAMAGSARRSMIANSMRQEMIDNQDLVAGIVTNYRGALKRVPAILKPVASSINPLYFEMRDLEFMSPSQPADTALRVIYHGIGTAHLPSLLKGLNPLDDTSVSDAFFNPAGAYDDHISRKIARRRGEELEELNPAEAQRQKVLAKIWRRHPGAKNGLPHGDFMELLGASGGVLASLVDKFEGDERRLYDSLVSLIVPGVYGRSADVLYSAVWEYALDQKTKMDLPRHLIKTHPTWDDPYAEPKLKGHHPYAGKTNEFMRWSVRRLLGLGTQPEMLEDELNLGFNTKLDDSHVFKRSPLRKMYDAAAKELSKSYTEPTALRVKNLVSVYRETGADKDALMGRIQRDLHALEETVGTPTARRIWNKYFPKNKYPRRDEYDWEGLIKEEADKAYRWVVRPFRQDLKDKIRKSSKVKQFQTDEMYSDAIGEDEE